jgi:hypothetical protein
MTAKHASQMNADEYRDAKRKVIRAATVAECARADAPPLKPAVTPTERIGATK